MDQVFKMSFESLLTYDVKRISDVYAANNPTLSDFIQTKKAFCIIDQKLLDHTPVLKYYFQQYDIEAHYFYVDISERNKSIETIMDFSAFCLHHKIGRRDAVIAFGGGIICDLGGMSASLLRRGIPCIKIPTTLLGIIDAAIGIKNGVNYANGKNSLGTFCPPKAVLIDLSFLQTLPEKEMKNGLVEMIKIFALKDKDSWDLLKQNIDKFIEKDFNSEVIELIDRSIAFMMDDLSTNLLETDLERVVDYGHEFGHLIEIVSEFELSHGEAVAIGMRLSNCLAYRLGAIDLQHYEDLSMVIDKLALPHWHESLSPQILYDKIDIIAGHKGGNFSIVALQEIGSPFFIKSLSFEDLEYACNVVSRAAAVYDVL